MDEKYVIDRDKGTKWFTYYTKVRPWLVALCFLAAVVPDFIYFNHTYIEHPMLLVFQHPMLLLSFILSAVQVVMCIRTFDKARGDYLEFVNYVKGVLVFEAYAATFQGFYTFYHLKGFVAALIAIVLFGLIGYYLWYKKMSEYFDARVSNAED